MRVSRRMQVTGALGLCVMGAPLMQRAWTQPILGREAVMRVVPVGRFGIRFGTTLRKAEWCWGEALIGVKPEMEALAAWDPEMAPGAAEGWRHQLMARDHGGYLCQGQAAAQRAVVLARTRQEEYQATVWLAIIECDRGCHQAELRQAQRLVELQPHNPVSLGALRRAARCNGREALAWKADTALQALEETAEHSGALAPRARWRVGKIDRCNPP